MRFVTFFCFIVSIATVPTLAFGADMTIGGVPPKCGISLSVSKTDEDSFFVEYRLEKKIIEIEECQCPVSSRILNIRAEGVDPDTTGSEAATGSYELSADMVSAELDLTLPKFGTYVASVRCGCEKCLKPAGRN